MPLMMDDDVDDVDDDDEDDYQSNDDNDVHVVDQLMLNSVYQITYCLHYVDDADDDDEDAFDQVQLDM